MPSPWVTRALKGELPSVGPSSDRHPVRPSCGPYLTRCNGRHVNGDIDNMLDERYGFPRGDDDGGPDGEIADMRTAGV